MHTQFSPHRPPRPIATPCWAALLNDPAVWSLTVLTEALSDAARQAFQDAFANCAASRGLQTHFSRGRFFIAPTTAPITTEDRGALMGWLCARTEVRFIHVCRRPVGQRPLGISCSPRRPSGRVQPPEVEDVSQEPEGFELPQEKRHGR